MSDILNMHNRLRKASASEILSQMHINSNMFKSLKELT